MISVLYVDDEPGLLEVARIFLEKDGQFSVDTATTASEALGILDSKTYEAIVSDYQMAGMDGIEFLKRVRAAGNTIPFIIFTGRGREQIVIQAMNEGADFYLQKGGDPVAQFAELGHKIRMAVEQRRAEASIRDLERRQADIINFLPDATFAINTQGVVIAWNRAMERMTRVRSPEILGKGNYEYAIPFYHERRPILIDLVLNNDPATTARYPFIKKDGKTLFSEIKIPHFNDNRGASLWFTASPLYDTQGTIVGAIESIREITERKQAEEGLRESERKYRTVFETTGTAMILIENDTTISLVNSVFERLSGYTKEEVENKKKWIEFVVEEDKDRMLVQHKLRRTDPGKALKQYEFRYITRSGEVRDIFLSIDLIPGSKTSVASLLDITERKKAGRALRESERKYRNVVEDQTEFISRFTPDGTHVFVNEAYCRYFGLKRDEILGHWFRPVIHPDDTGRVKSFFKSLTPEHPVDNIEQRIIMPDGKVQWQRWSDRAIFDTAGNVIEYQSVGRDVTETKEAEEGLRESEQKYRNVVEDQTEFISRFTPDGIHVFVNEAYCRYFGLKRDEILGHWFRPVIHPDDTKRVKEFFKSLTPEHPVDNIEQRIIMPDGKVQWQRWSDRAIFDTAGNVIEYQSVGRDITERKQEEQALHENEQRLNSIYNTVGDVIFQLTVEPDGQFRFTSVNSAFCRITGLPAERVIGRKVNEVIPEPSLSMVLEKYWQAIEEKVVVRWEETSSYPTGQLIGDVSVSPIFDRAGTCTHLIGSVHDITERKRADEALRESETRFRLLFNNQRDAVAVHKMGKDNQPTNFIQVNDVACERLGYTREEMLTMSPQDIDAPDRSGQMPAIIEKLFKTKYVLFETEHITKDGHRIPVEVSTVLFQLDDSLATISVARDITERKHAEEALRESEERFRKIYENSPLGMTLVTPDFRFFSVNPAWVSMTGYPEEELLKMTFKDITHPDHLARDMEHIRELKAGIIPVYSTEKRYIRKDGSILWGLLKVTTIRDQQGTLRYFGTQIEDITERKKAEQALRENEERLYTILQAVQTGIIIIDVEKGTILDANRKALSMIGTGPDEVIGSVCHRFICPYDVGRCPVTDLHQTIDTSERILITGSGDTIPILKTVIPATIGGRNVLVESFLDISDMKKRDERIQLLAGLLDITPASVTVHDTEGRFLYANARTFEYHGYTEEEFFRINLHELDVPDSEQLIEERIRNLKEWGEYSFEVKHFRKDGSILPLLVNTKMTEWGGRPVILSIATEITEHKQEEEVLEKRKKGSRAPDKGSAV